MKNHSDTFWSLTNFKPSCKLKTSRAKHKKWMSETWLNRNLWRLQYIAENMVWRIPKERIQCRTNWYTCIVQGTSKQHMTLVANQVIHKHTKSIVISHKCVKTSSTAPISFISEKFPYHDKCLKLEELERCYLSIHGTTLLLTPDDAL